MGDSVIMRNKTVTIFFSLLMLAAAGVAILAGADAMAAEGMAKPWQLNFQEPVTPVMKELYQMHYWLVVLITVVSVFVLALLLYVCVRFRKAANPVPSKNTHNTIVEIVWTVVPVIILIGIAIPSFRLHFDCIHSIGCTEDGTPVDPDLTLKVIGYQWYWNYEYPEHEIQFDSYMKKEEDLLEGEPRLLAVDNPIVVPVNANVRVLVTGGDVIHAWAMPAFGVKQDTVPGRLNETWFRAEKEGTYYGQCSELCGRLHGFMPIHVEVVDQAFYDQWIAAAKDDMEAASKLVAEYRGRGPNQFAETTNQ